MKRTKTILITILSCAAFFLFTEAKRISPRKLRRGNITWYFNQPIDSAGFFSADTLKFTNPHPKLWVSNSQFDIYQSDERALKKYPQIQFGYFQKNEFQIDLNQQDSIFKNGKMMVHYNIFDGMFSINRKTQIITFNFYTFDDTKASDDIDDWIKSVSKKYRIAELSKGSLVLVKTKNE